MTKPNYYPINEQIARVAKELNSFSEYKPDQATNEYKTMVDSVYAIVDQIETAKPHLHEKAVYMADRYSKKLADYINAENRNDASCPSVMICGPANFPVKKKQRQNARRDSLMQEYNSLKAYRERIKDLLYKEQPIKASDADAIERLTDKLNDLEADKETMKALNAYYRKHNTVEGYPEEISGYMQRHIDFMIKNGFARRGLFDTSNTNAEIKRIRDRIEKLTAIKEQGTTETEHEDFSVVENTELMRLQVLFDTIPDEKTRDILKHNGFKWSPKNQAWQRQLTDNARYSLNRIIKELA